MDVAFCLTNFFFQYNIFNDVGSKFVWDKNPHYISEQISPISFLESSTDRCIKRYLKKKRKNNKFDDNTSLP